MDDFKETLTEFVEDYLANKLQVGLKILFYKNILTFKVSNKIQS